jgi:hypothetical protein
MAPGVGDGRRANGEGQQQQANGNNNSKHGCVCGFPVCACAGAAAVASAASSADMDRVVTAAATEGQIGAVNDESWVAVDLSDDLSGDGGDDGVAIEDRPVFRTEKIKGILLHPYRYTSFLQSFIHVLCYTLSSALLAGTRCCIERVPEEKRESDPPSENSFHCQTSQPPQLIWSAFN